MSKKQYVKIEEAGEKLTVVYDSGRGNNTYNIIDSDIFQSISLTTDQADKLLVLLQKIKDQRDV